MGKSRRRLVRLANLAIEDEDSVGAIMTALRRISVEHTPEFVLLAKWQSGKIDRLPDRAEKVARKYRLLLPEEKTPVLYGDVSDVLASVLAWKGNNVSLGSIVLHADQTKITEAAFGETLPEPSC